ncbi:MAG: S-methyl-5'-thioadenosine phosphorylase [Acidobacteria bacterium]|nr:S-methyl-5'-thioadenosine phosphorylase [Acidobacteriota bacterium]MBI3656182.1 S-methyl-5'-thioadenosine phosphorylase [Acidobacteriota bacterium]
MEDIKYGIIGGSGLYQMDDLKVMEEVTVDTPFGPPSDAYIIGRLDEKKVAFLPRHGRGHRILPSELNFRANIFGFKALGVERLLSVSAVGSLKVEHKPLDIVLPDQFFDRTRGRASTFFGQGIVAHVSFADPICPDLINRVQSAGHAVGINMKRGGTYLCMEGPAFSTRAESLVYRSWGMDLIGMTNLQEAKLAREAEICYVTIALVTDYDCWYEHAAAVNTEMIIANLTQNIKNAQKVLRQSLRDLTLDGACSCRSALKDTIFTDPAVIPAAAKARLRPIIGKYLRA